jgi:hypothetical protein
VGLGKQADVDGYVANLDVYHQVLVLDLQGDGGEGPGLERCPRGAERDLRDAGVDFPLELSGGVEADDAGRLSVGVAVAHDPDLGDDRLAADHELGQGGAEEEGVSGGVAVGHQVGVGLDLEVRVLGEDLGDDRLPAARPGEGGLDAGALDGEAEDAAVAVVEVALDDGERDRDGGEGFFGGERRGGEQDRREQEGSHGGNFNPLGWRREAGSPDVTAAR